MLIFFRKVFRTENGEIMEYNSIISQVDRWFAESSTNMMYITARDVDDALAEQEDLERKQRRPIRIWEVLVLLRRLSVEQVDHILETLGKSSDISENSDQFTMLGRVLVEVGYATQEDVTEALRIQSEEREKGQWRMLGQILIEKRVILKTHLQEALDVLEVRRKTRTD
jgi:hypothetical protein